MVRLIQNAIPLRAAPYVRLAKRILRGPGTPQSVAFEEEVLCPEETSATRPPIFLPGQLDRVTGATEHQPVKAEVESMLAPVYKHAATVAYHIKDAIIFDGSVYAGNLRHFITEKSLFSSASEPRHLKIAGLASTTIGAQYFGHWLRDDCIQYILAEKTGAPLCIGGADSDHKRQYASYFGQNWTPTDRAVVDDLIIYQDFAQNGLKLERYRLLTNKIQAKFFFPQKRSELVYLRRGLTGNTRTIQDEATLINTLLKIGFVVVDIATDDLKLVLETLAQAKLVVSIEGSHVCHCCYTFAENCGLLTLQPSNRFTAIQRHWAECIGVHFGFVVGIPGQVGHVFSIDEILSTIEMMLKQIDLQRPAFQQRAENG
jgi:hypothetical protein